MRLKSSTFSSPDLYPLFKYTITEKIHKVHVNVQKVIYIEFFSKSDINSEWILEYSKVVTKTELDSYNFKKVIQSLKDNYYQFQEKNFDRFSMFLVDGILYGSPSLDYVKKEIHGSLINKDLYYFLGPSKVIGDIGSFDLMELYSFDDARISFFETKDLVIIGRYMYLNGKIVQELTDVQFEASLESATEFCEEYEPIIRKYKVKNVFHEDELVCQF
jgi:hypothetical protein